MVLSDIFSRLAGEHSAPALHRLETAFGGGKTHTLIALTHLGFSGRELAAVTHGIIDSQLLHAPGEATVVGIARVEIPVHKPQGSDLAPYTLWDELAYQIGGEALYRQVETDVTSPAAPDRRFFKHILEARKVVIMLAELAQYTARLEAARPHGSEQLTAVLLARHGYARTHAGIAVVLTLASENDAFALAAGQSRARLADQKNTHPAGFPLFEYPWKTVFLHSLVGRAEGLGSNLFGIAERDTLFEVAFPSLTPPQIEIALHEIDHSDYFLRFRQGRYYASLEPSIPRALAGIRTDLRGEEICSLLDATARKVVDKRTPNFQVEHDVSVPEHVPDKTNKPVLALIALGSDETDVERFVTTAGPNRPRLQQNLVFLLVPETVRVKGELWSEDRVVRAQEVRNHPEDMARTILAMR